MEFDAVIVGAGPVGLSLALKLGMSHWNVLLLEKEQKLHEHSRAPAIWPRTQEIFSDLGVIDQILFQGIIHKTLVVTDADSTNNKPLIKVPLVELSNKTKFPQLVILPQEKTEKILLSEIQKKCPSVVMKFSSEFVNFKEDTNSVVVNYIEKGQPTQAKSLFLLGCDGAHSRVRESLGFHLEGITYPANAALVDIRLHCKKPYLSPRITTTFAFTVAIEVQPNYWRLILPYSQASQVKLEKRVEKATNNLFPNCEYEIVWQSEFKLHQRISNSFQKGRVVLAGDSAHLNSPVGGQGMNAGIQDGAKLAQALHESRSSDSLEAIEKYADLRHKEIRLGVNQFTNFLTKLFLFKGGRYIKVIFRIVNVLLYIKPFRDRVLKRISMLEK